ncbi:unnamed protein product [Ilex paraguariensis]|uniref:Bifunctional inhibitor/plant lipid transfer protein/seed storage helical domain-containing protein n=1 Tax=Ilex paraguariensis TaxID=185542 RepID=A0ABC8R5P0_9AQUA
MVMKMRMPCAALCVVLVLFLGGAQVSMAAVTCNPIQLSPCASAITSSTTPTPICCSKLKEQKPCLCKYLKDPNLQKFINSPNARKVATTCGTPFPNYNIGISVVMGFS